MTMYNSEKHQRRHVHKRVDKYQNWGEYFYFIFNCFYPHPRTFFSLLLEREEGGQRRRKRERDRDRERQRETSMRQRNIDWLTLVHTSTETEPTT